MEVIADLNRKQIETLEKIESTRVNYKGLLEVIEEGGKTTTGMQ